MNNLTASELSYGEGVDFFKYKNNLLHRMVSAFPITRITCFIGWYRQPTGAERLKDFMPSFLRQFSYT
jgi:hypothetical protein